MRGCIRNWRRGGGEEEEGEEGSGRLSDAKYPIKLPAAIALELLLCMWSQRDQVLQL